MGTEAKRSFLSLNKGPLRQIVLPRLISFGLFFLLPAPHEGICGRGQTFHLIKDTFHISSPLSPVISLFARLSCLSLSLSLPPASLSLFLLLCLPSFLSSIIGSPEVPFAVTVPFWLALDAFWNRWLSRALMLPSNRYRAKLWSHDLDVAENVQPAPQTSSSVKFLVCKRGVLACRRRDWSGGVDLNGFFRNQHYLFWKVKGSERVLCLTLFYFWGWLLEDYCKWQSIHYLDGSSGVGERVVS